MVDDYMLAFEGSANEKTIVNTKACLDGGTRQFVFSWTWLARKGSNFTNKESVEWWDQSCTSHVDLFDIIGAKRKPSTNQRSNPMNGRLIQSKAA